MARWKSVAIGFLYAAYNRWKVGAVLSGLASGSITYRGTQGPRGMLLALLLLLPASHAAAQATSISAPPGNYLVEVTQRWAAHSPLGTLVDRRMSSGDVELRVWGGYGLTQTTGVIMRRTAGRWQAWRAEAVPCSYAVPIPVGDTASPATESLFVRRAHEHCGASLDSTAYGETVYSADTLAVTEVPAENLEAVWRSTVAAGVRKLPPRVPRKWMMLDGFTYVIELREGGSYHASAIEALETPEVEADRQARAIYEIVQRAIPRAARSRQPR